MQIDTKSITKILTEFIADCIQKTSSKNAVVGLSGGLDSSIVAALSVRAVGKDSVAGVLLPYRLSSEASKTDANNLAVQLGISVETVDITSVADTYFGKYKITDDNRKANYLARQRMAVLYDVSTREKGLVIGTSNKSEILLGYGTIYGDLGHAINPVGDLYKTQMRQLAEYLEIPETIRQKKPSADLIVDQTDEDDFGFTYEEIDKFFYLWLEKNKSESQLEEIGYKKEFINDVLRRVQINHFKRIPPLIAKVSPVTIGVEFNYGWEWSVQS